MRNLLEESLALNIKKEFLQGELDYARAVLLEGTAREEFNQDMEVDENLVGAELDNKKLHGDSRVLLLCRQHCLRHVRERLDGTRPDQEFDVGNGEYERIEEVSEWYEIGLNAYLTLSAIKHSRSKLRSFFPHPHIQLEIARQHATSSCEGIDFLVEHSNRFNQLVHVPDVFERPDAENLRERVRHELTKVLDFVEGRTMIDGREVEDGA